MHGLVVVVVVAVAVVMAVGRAVEAAVESQDLARPDRIVGGTRMERGEALWQVSIQSNYGRHFCGGSLVAAEWVLTAAHCTKTFSVDDMRVALGPHALSEVTKLYEVEEIIRHEDFDKKTMENDIALLKLRIGERDYHEGESIQLERDEELKDLNCTVTGFGRLSEGGAVADVMNGAAVSLQSEVYCREAFRNTRLPITPGHVCAGGGDQDACQGDSGGPLVCCARGLRSDGGCRLVGITSWGIGCATPGLPGVYTKVAHFTNWIIQHLSRD